MKTGGAGFIRVPVMRPPEMITAAAGRGRDVQSYLDNATWWYALAKRDGADRWLGTTA